MSLTATSRLGPYEVIAPIGAGGMGEVYKGRDTRLERTVAIKILPSELAGDPQFRDRFDREAKTISALNHPNICTLYDVGEAVSPAAKGAFGSTLRYLVLEFLEEETLAARLEEGALPLPEALRIGLDIINALEAAHRHGIVHRDLKPGNVMLTKSGAKLLDFGLAKSTPLVAGVSPMAPTLSAGTAPLTGTRHDSRNVPVHGARPARSGAPTRRGHCGPRRDTHYFKGAGQLTTSVIGAGLASRTDRFTRNRPSEQTS